MLFFCVFLIKASQIAESSPIYQGQSTDSAIKYSDLSGEGIESIEQGHKAASDETINSNEISINEESNERNTRKVNNLFYCIFFVEIKLFAVYF